VQPLSLEKGEDSGESFDIEKIIKLANCEFIYDLPNGLDTEIGERGVKLS
jgi:ABC-type multidrug transport system fused ATPase/permease subunit